MKPMLLLSLIISIAFTLTACDENGNSGTASPQVEEIETTISESTSDVDDKVEEISESVEESTSEAAEIIKDNLESIHENEDSNP